MYPPEVTVLLDRDVLGHEVRGTPFYRKSVADSIEAIQKVGQLQVPTYALANGRIYADKEKKHPSEIVWTMSYEGLGERLLLRAEKAYQSVPEGVYVVDLQGAGIFMARPDEIRRVVMEHDSATAYSISSQEKDLLLGEKYAYKWNGTKLDIIPVTFFPSNEAFAEEAKTAAFKKSIREMSAVYAVLRPIEEAEQYPSGARSITEQLKNPNLQIPLGGVDQLKAMLFDEEGQPRFGFQAFGFYSEDDTIIDSGHRVVLLDNNLGVVCNQLFDGDGFCVGLEKNLTFEQLAHPSAQTADLIRKLAEVNLR